jgi:hypothetical protein
MSNLRKFAVIEVQICVLCMQISEILMYTRYQNVHIVHANGRGATVDASLDLSTPFPASPDADAIEETFRCGISLGLPAWSWVH